MKVKNLRKGDIVEWDVEKFRKMFPNLYREMFSQDFPTILDHLEKCENYEQALEVIEYFEKRGEISREYALYLKDNVKNLGIIGTRKSGDYEKGLRC